MPRRAVLLTLCVTLLASLPATAQDFELTPFFGYRFGGVVDDFDLRREFDLEDTEVLGVILDFAVTEDLFVELLFARQQTNLEEESFFFADRPLFELDLDYYHAGVLYQWDVDRVKPFVAGSVGVTELDPRPSALSSETRPSVSFGGGVKLFFGDNFALRFEGRTYTTFVDEGDGFDCDDFDCYGYGDRTFLWQFEGRVGLVIAF